jgi:DNA-directed RNA polymerase I and III subunit RPAC2
MSVNEVKLQKAAHAFVIRGTGAPSQRTFCLGDEDHTLGNALRHVLMQDPNVTFAGYSVPHPSEPVVQIRVQTNGASTAIETLKTSCRTFSDQCDFVLQKLEALLPEVKEDRIQIEQKICELERMDEEQEDDDAVDMEIQTQ